MRWRELLPRNELHNALTSLHGPTWFDRPGLLQPDLLRKVAAVKSNLTRAGRPLDPGRIVAELSFGFWTQLYGRVYEVPNRAPDDLSRVSPLCGLAPSTSNGHRPSAARCPKR
jgi:hypothetical protein